MGIFSTFTKTGLIHSLRVIGEPASIGGNQFQAAFEDSEMNVTRHMFGDEDDISTMATCLKLSLIHI